MSRSLKILVLAGGSFVLGVLFARSLLPPFSGVSRVGDAHRASAAESSQAAIPGPDESRAEAPGLEGLTPEQFKKVIELRALGYLSGSRPAPKSSGVTVFQREGAYQGLNLLSDGHHSHAELMDMEGRILHRWSFRYADAFPASEAPPGASGTEYFRRVALLADGELLAIYEGQGLVKLDRDSRLVWAYPGQAHHDLEIAEDGRIWVLTREVEMLPRIDARDPVMHDAIVVLDPDGKEVDRISLLEALEASPYRGLLDFAPTGDLFHTNTLEILGGQLAERVPAFRRGNLLVSFRNINTIAVVDVEARRVSWALTGMWRDQHQPTLLPSGRMLLFDNTGAGGRSRVLEFDPATQEVAWSFDLGGRLFSLSCGSVQRLPNGNTLITESDAGRALEVTPDGRVVWEFLTPYRTGDEGDLIATLFEVVRLPSQSALGWLDAAAEAAASAAD